jgi:hypothetical protein
MLTSEEQELLAKLSVFAGNFDLDAATTVAGATPALLQSLHGKSLLSMGGDGHFFLHELLCQFAALKLAGEPGRQQRVLKRHCAHYTTVLLDIERACKQDVREVAGSLVRITDLYNNALSAWHFAVEHLLLQELSDSIYSLSLFFEFQSLFHIGKELLEEVLEKFVAQGLTIPRALKLRLLTHYGWLCQDIGEGPLALRSFEEAHALSQELTSQHDDDKCILHFFYGWTLHFHARSAQGLAYLDQGRHLL